MTATDDHGTLPVHAERMLQRLERLEGISVHGETRHMQHTDHARRAAIRTSGVRFGPERGFEESHPAIDTEIAGRTASSKAQAPSVPSQEAAGERIE